MANTKVEGTVQTLTDAWFPPTNLQGIDRGGKYLVVPIANAPQIREAVGRRRASLEGRDWPTRPDFVGPGKQGPPGRRGVFWYVDFRVDKTGTLAAFPHDAVVQEMIGKTVPTDGTVIPPKGEG
jgi:hypothetical protein